MIARKSVSPSAPTTARPLGAFVPIAWHVITRLRAEPAPDGTRKAVIAFVGGLEPARYVLEFLSRLFGPIAYVCLVNAEAAPPASPWERADWVLEHLRVHEACKIVTPIRRVDREWAFTLPRPTFDRIIARHGLKAVRGSLILTAIEVTVLGGDHVQLSKVRAFCLSCVIADIAAAAQVAGEGRP